MVELIKDIHGLPVWPCGKRFCEICAEEDRRDMQIQAEIESLFVNGYPCPPGDDEI